MKMMDPGHVKARPAARLAAMISMLCAWSGPALADIGDIPCTCRYQGQDIPQGQTICATINGRDVMMRCESVLNNTAWKHLQDECPRADISAPISKAAVGGA